MSSALPRRIAFLLLAALAVGTVSAPSFAAKKRALPSPKKPFELPATISDCVEVFAFILVDMAQAQSGLPEGFTAKDAQDFFVGAGIPFPAPTGMGVIVLTIPMCEGSEFEGGGPLTTGDLYIYIEQPDLGSDHPLEPVVFDFYEAAIYTTGKRQLRVLSSIGYTAIKATSAESIFSPLPVGPGSGSSEVSEAEGQVGQFEYVAGVDSALDGKARFFQQTGAGTGYFELEAHDEEVIVGPVTQCTLGLHAAKVVGATSCSPGSAYAVVFPDGTFTGVFRWLPGIFAG